MRVGFFTPKIIFFRVHLVCAMPIYTDALPVMPQIHKDLQGVGHNLTGVEGFGTGSSR